MDDLRRPFDDRAEDSIIPPIVFLASLLITVTLLFVFMGQFYAESASSGNFDAGTGYAVIGGDVYSVLRPYDGYTLTTANVSNTWEKDGSKNFYFYEDAIDDDDRVDAALIRNNNQYIWDGSWILQSRYLDYFHFRIEYGWWSVKSAGITLDTVIANQEGETNLSVTPLDLGSRHYTFLVQTGAAGDGFAASVMANLMNVSIGVSLEDQLGSQSAWTILSQILSMQLPDTHPIISFLIAVPFWTMIGLVAFLVLMKALPFFG